MNFLMYKRKGIPYLILFCVSLCVLGAGAIVKGPFISLDSDDLLRAGDKIISWVQMGEPSYAKLNELLLFPQYAISCTLISTAYMVRQETGVIVLNSVLFSLTVCLVFSVWCSIYGNWESWTGKRGFVVGAAVGLYIVFGLPDAFLWSYAVLTDIVFLFWVAMFVAATTQGLLRHSVYWWLLALFVALTAPFVRPTGFILPLLFLYALGLFWISSLVQNLRSLILVSLLTPAVFAFLVVPWLVIMEINAQPMVERLIPDFLEGHFLQSVYYFQNGTIISNRYEIELDTTASYLTVLYTIICRLGYYWIPLRFGELPYSLVHNIINLIYMILAVPMLYKGTRVLASHSRTFATIALFLIMVSYSYAILHSITLVSFDWRYQLPAMIPLWILFGCGVFATLGYNRHSKSG